MIELKCNCEKHRHEIPTKVIEVSEHAIEKVPAILADYHRIFMVADENTYEVAGRRVFMDCAGAGHARLPALLRLG